MTEKETTTHVSVPDTSTLTATEEEEEEEKEEKKWSDYASFEDAATDIISRDLKEDKEKIRSQLKEIYHRNFYAIHPDDDSYDKYSIQYRTFLEDREFYGFIQDEFETSFEELDKIMAERKKSFNKTNRYDYSVYD